MDNNRAGDALLWLKRSLQLICIFFENICLDKQCLQSLKLHLKDAYERTLKPYHGFLIQNTIKVKNLRLNHTYKYILLYIYKRISHLKVIYSQVPTRADILGQDTIHEENIDTLSKKFLPALFNSLDCIDKLLQRYDLDSHKKV